MRGVVKASSGIPLWAARYGSWFLAALITASAAVPVVAAIGDLDQSFPAPAPRSQNAVVAISAGLMIWVLQLRHSLAAVRDERPRGWPVSLFLLVLLAAAPWWLFSVNWISTTWFPVASAVMALRGRPAARLVAVALVAQGVVASWASIDAGESAASVVVFTVYNVVFLGFGVGALYWSALLVGRINDLVATRVDLAHSMVAGERRRVSRDLHDLLGQSLSTISLKGDLALRLLPTQRDTALNEIEEIIDVSRTALAGVEAIARAEHEINLQSEIESAVTLLEAGGVDVRRQLDLTEIDPPAGTLLAWAVREATTNILRHSEAQRCWLTGRTENGTLHMEIANDGVGRSAIATDQGSGLKGLSERARELGGIVRVERGTGRFRLVVEVPA